MKTNASLKSNVTLKAKTGLKPKKTPKKRKVPTVTKLKRDADKYWSLATRLRFAYTGQDGDWWARCITCNAAAPIKKLQCGHFMSRMHNIVRFDEQNTAPQCYGCNVMHQGRQYEFGLEIDRLYGDGTAKGLAKLSKTSHQFKTEELEQIIADCKEEISFYLNQEVVHEQT